MQARQTSYVVPTARIEVQQRVRCASDHDQAACALTGDAIRLMCRLEGKIALSETADRFPRVLNRIAALWKKPVDADRYFDELLHDSRGGRQGFPLPVLSEINALRDFYVTRVYPKRVDPWEQVLYR
jgi:hypothetical protein